MLSSEPSGRIQLGVGSAVAYEVAETQGKTLAKKGDAALIIASGAAMNELLEFAQSEPPSSDTWEARLMLQKITVIRHLMFLIPGSRQLFERLWPPRPAGEPGSLVRSLARLGGIEKAYTLLVVARFDINQDGEIDADERREYQMQGERLINNAIQGCQNTALVAAMLIGASHLANIGRPVPWSASDEFVRMHGQDIADGLLWVTFACNVLVELGALLLLGYCTFGRVLLVYVLPSLGSRLTFLVESNLPGTLSHSIFALVACAVTVLMVGAFLALPRAGLIALVLGPLFALPLALHCSYYWFQATLVLHRQAQLVFHDRRRQTVYAQARSYMEKEEKKAKRAAKASPAQKRRSPLMSGLHGGLSRMSGKSATAPAADAKQLPPAPATSSEWRHVSLTLLSSLQVTRQMQSQKNFLQGIGHAIDHGDGMGDGSMDIEDAGLGDGGFPLPQQV